MKKYGKMSSTFMVLILFIYVVILKKQVVILKEEAEKLSEKDESARATRALLLLWLEHKMKGDKIQSYFKEHQMKRVAIYGMGEVGTLLYKELLDTDIDIVCGIDKTKNEIGLELKLVRPEEFIEEADAVVVTPVYYFSEAYDVMNKNCRHKITVLGLDEVLYGLGEN